jgi:NAD(P)-dependent dehydrogenase (short-subunit alcohol dehydrogenase family)
MFKMYYTIIGITVLLLAFPCVATWCGHGFLAWAIFAACVLVLYCIAPARKFPTAESICSDVDLTGKVVLITGPTSGIGQETARVLAKRGAHVVLAARNVMKLETTKKDIEDSLSSSPNGETLIKAQLTCLQCDLDDLASVRKCAEQFAAMNLPLDILICNAGVMAVPSRSSTKQGLEQQVGVCHVAHFFLTQLLMPQLEKAAPSRVVVLSSSAYRLHEASYLKEPRFETEPYDAWTAYGNAKVSNCLFARELNARFQPSGITAFSCHPGGIHTGLQGNVEKSIALAWTIVTPFMFKSIPQGAATTMLCATKPGLEASAGKFFDNCAPTDVAEKMAKKLSDEIGTDAQTQLWSQTESLLKSLKC